MVEKAKHEVSDQLKEVTIQLRNTEELKKEAEDQAFFMKDEIKELHDEVKSGIDKAARLNNEVNKDDVWQDVTRNEIRKFVQLIQFNITVASCQTFSRN